jgi:hypothetical protein
LSKQTVFRLKQGLQPALLRGACDWADLSTRCARLDLAHVFPLSLMLAHLNLKRCRTQFEEAD